MLVALVIEVWLLRIINYSNYSAMISSMTPACRERGTLGVWPASLVRLAQRSYVPNVSNIDLPRLQHLADPLAC
jgi:hypothetical protein